MGRKGKWFTAVKRVLFPSCCRRDHVERLGMPKHPAQVAAEVIVVHVTCSTPRHIQSAEEIAAIKIQAAFRGYLARREMLALRRLIRLKTLVDGSAVKSQTANALHCMQIMAKVQAQIRSRRIRMAEENQALLRQLQQKREKESEKAKIGEQWNDSPRSKEQIEANLLKRREAALRREKSLSYALFNQWKGSSRSLIPMFTDFNNPQWGWSWSEHWMAARPSENPSMKEINDPAPAKSAIHSAIKQTTKGDLNPSAAQKPIQPQSPRSKPASVASGKKPVSPRDDSSGKHSVARPPVREEKRRLSAPPVPSYLTPAASTRTMSRFHSLQSDRAGAPEKGPVSPVKKSLSLPVSGKSSVSSAAGTRRHSMPPKVSISLAKGGAANKEKAARNGVKA